jgi:DNA-binding transcriptional MerR regulator
VIQYQIHELERLTGVKAGTIRILEKRYGLVSPERTDTNRRYYSDKQLRKLLNVATLLAFGHKISRIASLSENDIDDRIQVELQKNGSGHVYLGYTNDMVMSMLAFDEISFEKIFSTVVLRYGLYEAMVNIVYPFLNKVGVLWSVGKTSPVQEHFASCIIRRKLMAATDGLFAPDKKSKKFLLFLPPSEWHEIGLLFANYIIRAAGNETIYLGQNVPYENVEKIIPMVLPGYILLFYVTQIPFEKIESQLKALANGNPYIPILVCGNPNLFREKEPCVPNVTYLYSVPDLFNYIN